MAPLGTYITKLIYANTSNLRSILPLELQQGWQVVYVIPTVGIVSQVPPSFEIQYDGSLKLKIPISPVQIDNYEILLLKFDYPVPEACPRCSPLNPDRLDREN